MTLIGIAQAFLVLGITTFCSYNSPAMAQTGPDCSFNGATEACIITTTTDGTKRVMWTSDGKVLEYSFYRCQAIASETALRCMVRIVEDTGRVSNGVAEIGGRGTVIRSAAGNSTYLPIRN
jgi:hypothetical protein